MLNFKAQQTKYKTLRRSISIKACLAGCFMMGCVQSLQANSYLGFNLGGNSVNVKKELSYPLDTSPLTINRYTAAYTNFHAQLFAGYRLPFVHFFKPFHVAAEANWDFFTGSAKNEIRNWFLETNAVAKEKLRYSYAFFLLPEYNFSSNGRIFIGPGFSQGELLVASSITGGNVGVSSNVRRWLSGWGIKAGVGRTFTSCVEMLLTYEFLRYDRVSTAAVEPLSEETLSGIYRPYVNLLTVGLKFNL